MNCYVIIFLIMEVKFFRQLKMLTNITGLRLQTAAMMVEKSPIRLNSQLIHKSINKSIYKLKIKKKNS